MTWYETPLSPNFAEPAAAGECRPLVDASVCVVDGVARCVSRTSVDEFRHAAVGGDAVTQVSYGSDGASNAGLTYYRFGRAYELTVAPVSTAAR